MKRRRSEDRLGVGDWDNPEPSSKSKNRKQKPPQKVSAPPPSPGPDLDLANLAVPTVLPFKLRQTEDRNPKSGANRGRHWKHLKQILQAEDYSAFGPDQPTYSSIDAPPSPYPPKRYCDITGLEAPYLDPYTKLRYANASILAIIRCLTPEQVQALLGLRNAQTVLR